MSHLVETIALAREGTGLPRGRVRCVSSFASTRPHHDLTRTYVISKFAPDGERLLQLAPGLPERPVLVGEALASVHFLTRQRAFLTDAVSQSLPLASIPRRPPDITTAGVSVWFDAE